MKTLNDDFVKEFNGLLAECFNRPASRLSQYASTSYDAARILVSNFGHGAPKKGWKASFEYARLVEMCGGQAAIDHQLDLNRNEQY